MRTSVVVLFVASACGAWSWSATGRACAGACDTPTLVLGASGHVPVGGNVLIECGGCSQSLGDFSAVDAQGATFEGRTRFVAQGAQPTWLNVASPRRYFLWQPKTALAAGQYWLRAPSGTTFCDARGLAEPFSVVAAVEPPLQLTTAVELGLREMPSGGTFRCSDACDPALVSTRLAELPYARINLQLADADPRLATHLARVRAEYPTGELFGGFLGLREFLPRSADDLADRESFGGLIGVVFPTLLGRYCVALELMDVASGTLELTERQCVEPDFGAQSARPVDQASACQTFSDATPADYRRAFCSDNAADCRTSDASPACQSWRRQCGTAEMDAAVLDAGTKIRAGDAATVQRDPTLDDDAGPAGTDGATRDPDSAHDASADTVVAARTMHGVRVHVAARERQPDCSASLSGGRADSFAAWIVSSAVAAFVARRRARRTDP